MTNNTPSTLRPTTVKLDDETYVDLDLVAWIDSGGNNSAAIRRLIRARAHQLRTEKPELAAAHAKKQAEGNGSHK